MPTFLPWRWSGGLLFLSGQTCLRGGAVPWQGPLDDPAAMAGAWECAGLNLLAALTDAVAQTGRLPRGWVSLRLFYQGALAPDRAAMEGLAGIFGCAGAGLPPAPGLVGVTQLPLNSSVTADAVHSLG